MSNDIQWYQKCSVQQNSGMAPPALKIRRWKLHRFWKLPWSQPVFWPLQDSELGEKTMALKENDLGTNVLRYFLLTKCCHQSLKLGMGNQTFLHGGVDWSDNIKIGVIIVLSFTGSLTWATAGNHRICRTRTDQPNHSTTRKSERKISWPDAPCGLENLGRKHPIATVVEEISHSVVT